jgi:hypothetical protein
MFLPQNRSLDKELITPLPSSILGAYLQDRILPLLTSTWLQVAQVPCI